MIPRSVPIDRHALAFQFIGQFVDIPDILDRRLIGKIHRLADGIVRVLLECRLHPDMILRRDVMGRNEDIANIGGDFLDVPNRAVFGNLFHEASE